MVLPPHAHAVLQLGIVVVKLRLRQRTARGQVPLVTGIDDAAAIFLPAFAAVFSRMSSVSAADAAS